MSHAGEAPRSPAAAKPHRQRDSRAKRREKGKQQKPHSSAQAPRGTRGAQSWPWAGAEPPWLLLLLHPGGCNHQGTAGREETLLPCRKKQGIARPARSTSTSSPTRTMPAVQAARQGQGARRKASKKESLICQTAAAARGSTLSSSPCAPLSRAAPRVAPDEVPTPAGVCREDERAPNLSLTGSRRQWKHPNPGVPPRIFGYHANAVSNCLLSLAWVNRHRSRLLCWLRINFCFCKKMKKIK